MMCSTLFSEWKLEPVSPLSSEESQVSEDVALYGVSSPRPHQPFDINSKQFEIPSETTKFEIASKLLDDLEHLDNLDDFIKEDFEEWIKDEPFSNWLEEKMLPTMFDDVQPQPLICFNALKYEPLLVPDTPSLLREFENVFDAVEMARGTLTPPQSPPYHQPQQMYTKLEPLLVTYPTNVTPIDYHHPPPIEEHQNDVAQELAIVDEIIRTRVEGLTNYPSSPGSASFSSGSSNFDDCSSDDPEWIPETIECSSPTSDLTEKPTSRKRSKPYSRPPPEDKKIRKKEQNKNAATRYRMKKKAELEVILDEERLLAMKNTGLEGNIADLQREIKYLKGLMRDLFKAKGLIN